MRARAGSVCFSLSNHSGLFPNLQALNEIFLTGHASHTEIINVNLAISVSYLKAASGLIKQIVHVLVVDFKIADGHGDLPFVHLRVV